METASLVALLTLIGCNPNGPAAPDPTPGETPPPSTAEVAPETVPERPPARLCSDPEAFDQLVELPDEPRPLELRGGRTQAFPLASSRDETLEIVAHQDGIDVYLALFDPDTGARLVATDRPTARLGEERLLWVTEADKPLRLHVCAWGEDTISGTYTLSVQRRAIEPDDRVTVTATQNLEEAKRLVRLGPSRWDNGLALFATAVQEADTETGRFVWTEALYRQARTLQRQQRFEEALEILDVLAVEHDHQVFPEMAQRIFNRRALSQARAQQPDAAEESHLRALRVAKDSGNPILVARGYNYLGLFYNDIGEVSLAIETYDRALENWKRIGDEENSAGTLHNRGQGYRTLGKFQEALDDFEEALQIRQRLGSRRNQALTLGALASTLEGAGRIDDAENSLRTALAIYESIGDVSGRARVLTSLASNLFLQERFQEALEAGQQAAPTLNAQGSGLQRGILAHNIGLSLRGLGRLEESMTHYQSALQAFGPINDLRASSLTRLAIAQVHREQGDLEAALASILAAIDDIEEHRGMLASYDSRSAYFATRRAQYDFHVDLLMELFSETGESEFLGQAIAASEKARARSQLDALKDRGNRSAELEMGNVEDPARARIINRLEETRARLREIESDPEAILRIERELRRELQRYRREQSAEAGNVSQPLQGLRSIQAVLDEETTLLEVHLGYQTSYLWIIQDDSVETVELPARREIEAVARETYRLAAKSYQRRWRVPLSRNLCTLSQLLLGSVDLERLETRRLAIASEGALSYIPFGTLPHPEACQGRLFTELSWVTLGRDFEMISIPSASLLQALREAAQDRPRPTREILVVADPTFDVGPESATRRAFDPLVHSRTEAQSILDVLGANDALSLFGAEASRENVLSADLDQFGILHFATHGELNAEHPELSRLVLATSPELATPEDQFLFAHEIRRLNLRADLVVLSACETALGRELRGEGMVGLPQAFMVAGASAIVVSLWKIDDATTGTLMGQFYKNLAREQMTLPAALAKAQESVRASHPEPFYWAGFVLVGDWQSYRTQ